MLFSQNMTKECHVLWKTNTTFFFQSFPSFFFAFFVKIHLYVLVEYSTLHHSKNKVQKAARMEQCFRLPRAGFTHVFWFPFSLALIISLCMLYMIYYTYYRLYIYMLLTCNVFFFVYPLMGILKKKIFPFHSLCRKNNTRKYLTVGSYAHFIFL